MAIIRNIAHKVFRCFWRIERWADHLTGKAGPVFITLAVLLILMAIITYFDVIFPLSFLREETEPWKSMIALIFSLYLTACCTIHYYHACSIPPGSPSEPINSQLRSNHIGSNYQHRSFLSCPRTLRRWWSPKPHRIGSIKQEMIEQYRSNLNNHYCKKCLRNGIKGIDGRGPIKPERAHHCRICGICQLKYDHHCPWINQCVGLRNERSFLLFLFYMTISSAWIVVWGWTAFNASLNFTIDWPFWSPRIFVVLTWILALAIGVTIGIMFGWQLLLIIRGETTVESSDNEYYRKLFSLRGETYINPYNLGIRMNLEQFFNVGSEGKSRWYKIFLPIKISPSSDGWKWIKRPGYEHQIIDQNDQLTDQDDDLAPSSA